AAVWRRADRVGRRLAGARCPASRCRRPLCLAVLSIESPGLSRMGAERFARDWAEAVRRAGAVAMPVPAMRRFLLDQTVRLARAVTDEPFTVEPARSVGRALAEAGISGTDIAAWSARALVERFQPVVLRGGLDAAVVQDRLVQLGRALVAGYEAAAHGEIESTDTSPRGADAAHAGSSSADAAGGDTAAAALAPANDAERALRDSEARFRAVFTGAATGIGIADLAGRLIEVNQAFADMLGYSIAELRRTTVTALFHPEDAAELNEL